MASYQSNLTLAVNVIDASSQLECVERSWSPLLFGAVFASFNASPVLAAGDNAIALPSGGVSQCLIVNKDSGNTVTVKAGYGGGGLVTLGQVQPGGMCAPIFNVVAGGQKLTALTLNVPGQTSVEILLAA